MFFTSAQSVSSADNTTNNIWGSATAWGSDPSPAPAAALSWSSDSVSHGEEASGAPICKFFVSGNCSAGQECRFSHSIPTSSAFQDERTCEICSEDVLLKGCKFGLLENCDHVFCLACIREWRNQKEKQDRLNLRKCPICRVDSYVIIPSTHYMKGVDKAGEKIRYSQHLSMIPCKNYDQGKGQCPFGSSCLYMHSGSSEASFVLLKGADGTRTKKHSQLSDFLRRY